MVSDNPSAFTKYNLKDSITMAISNEVVKSIKNDILPPKGVPFESGDGSKDTIETFQKLGLATVIAIGFVYLLVTFEKARLPFVILSSLIFIPVRAIVYIADEPLSVSAMIDVLVLIGIVTTNAIVLVDRIGQNRQQKDIIIHDCFN